MRKGTGHKTAYAIYYDIRYLMPNLFLTLFKAREGWAIGLQPSTPV